MSQLRSSAGALGRMAGRHAGRDRVLRSLWTAGSNTARSVAHILHLLFLEITGFLFIVVALVGSGAALREYHRYKIGVTGPGRVVLAACFGLMFLWFGLTSFWRAKRKRA